MTQYDVLRLCESTLRMLDMNGIDAKDIRYLEMYREYERLMTEGHKITYIVEHLTDVYGFGAATIYRAVARMKKEIGVT
jgi:hypothetical protein